MKQYDVMYIEDLERTLGSKGYALIRLDTAGKQLGSMQAWEVSGKVRNNDTGKESPIRILQSYNTLVSYELNGEYVRCGKWGRTTSKQQTEWERYGA